MKRLTCLLVVLAGCTTSDAPDPDEAAAPVPCDWQGLNTLYLGPEHSLTRSLPDAGRTPGNGFDEAFLTNALDEWTTAPDALTFRIVGTLTLEFWTQGNAMPAPIVIGGAPGEGYHFFNQFGSDRGFIESYAVEYETAVGDDEVRRYVEEFTMPDGGYLIEAGDHLRLLLTNLVLDDEGGRGPDILWGGMTPSSITFEALCEPTPVWLLIDELTADVSVAAHQGLLTGAVPANEDVNYADVPFTLRAETDRIQIVMRETSSPNPTKNDMDLTIHDATGAQVWGIGSPYTDEVGTRWRENMDSMPAGEYVARVNSYSGVAYEGEVVVTQWQRV